MQTLNKIYSRSYKLLKKNWPFVLLILVTLSFFYKSVLQNQIPLPGDFVLGVYYPWLDYKWGYPAGVPVKNPITTDVVSLIFPEQMVGVDLLKNGQWPLWNPTILAGTPLFANLQAAPFSPTIFVYFLFDKLTAWSVQIILQHLLAASFMYLLLRRWKVSKLAASLGGVVYSFSGFNLIFSQWNGHTLASAFIPLALLFTDKIIQGGKYWPAVGLVLALVLQLLSGYPQTSLYTVFALGIYFIFSYFQNKETVLKSIKWFLLAGILSLGLAAFQLLPAKELWSLSQRSYEPHPYEWAFLPWSKIITVVAPDYFGNHVTGNYWGPQDYNSNTAYVGVVAFMLALLSLNKFKQNKHIKFLFLLSTLALFMSFPFFVPVFLWKYDILGMRAASAHRITILFTFSFSALAAYGYEYLANKMLKIRYSIFITALLLGGFASFTLALFLKNPDATAHGFLKYQIALRNLALPISIFMTTSILLFFTKIKNFKHFSLLIIYILLILELFRFGWKFTPFWPRDLVYPSTPVLDFIHEDKNIFRVTASKVIPSNMRTAYDLESLEGYETIHPLMVSKFLSSLNSGLVASPVGRYADVNNNTSKLLDLVNTKYYLTLDKNDNRFSDDRFRLVFKDKSVSVYESKSVLPRAFMVYNWDVLGDKEALESLLDPKFPFDGKVILNREISLPKSYQGKADVGYKKYSATESVIDVSTNSPGLLFISDSYYPGWRAFVDNQETPIYRADYMFRAIPVPAGQHEVKISYRPNSFFAGLKVSLLTALIIFTSGLWYILNLCLKKYRVK